MQYCRCYAGAVLVSGHPGRSSDPSSGKREPVDGRIGQRFHHLDALRVARSFDCAHFTRSSVVDQLGGRNLVAGDVIPLDLCVLAPREHGVTGQLGAVVADHHARQPATLDDGA
jgi:hypothetical protein